MTSSTSTHSTFSVLSEGCMSEVDCKKSFLRNSTEDLGEEECPNCAAMMLNTSGAHKALASLCEQFKDLQEELKKTEQVSKINEEQARYIDERRLKLEKLETERNSLYADFENLRISHDSLRRQYDEVIATARKNQDLIEESVKYRETCKVAMENLMAEKEARQELLSKYLKSVEAAAKINDSVKQLEKKCAQLLAAKEKLEPFKYHCPAMLRLLLDFGEIVENNGLMTKSLQKRFARYKNSDDLRDYLLQKTKRVEFLSESTSKMLGESSDDDELAKGVEELLAVIGNSAKGVEVRSSEITNLPRKEITNVVDKKTKSRPSEVTNYVRKIEIDAKTQDNLQSKQLERIKASQRLDEATEMQQDSGHNHEQKMDTLRKNYSKSNDKWRQEEQERLLGNDKAASENDMDPCEPSTSASFMAPLEKKVSVVDMERKKNESKKAELTIKTVKSVRRLQKIPDFAEEYDSIRTKTFETTGTNRNNEGISSCRCDKLSKWRRFAHLDPLLPEISKPTFLTSNDSEASEQHETGIVDVFIDEPLSDGTRTSISSTEVSGRGSLRSEMSGINDAPRTTDEFGLFGEPLSPSPIPESPTESTKISIKVTREPSESPKLNGCGINCFVEESVADETNNRMEIVKSMLSSGQSLQQETMAQHSNEPQDVRQQERDNSSMCNFESTERKVKTPSAELQGPKLDGSEEFLLFAAHSSFDVTSESLIQGSNFDSRNESSKHVISSLKMLQNGSRVPPSATAKEFGGTEEQFEIFETNAENATNSKRRNVNSKKNLEKFLIRLPEDKVRGILEMAKDKIEKLTECGSSEISAPTVRSLRHSSRQRERVQVKSMSSKIAEELKLDSRNSKVEMDTISGRRAADDKFNLFPECHISFPKVGERAFKTLESFESDSATPPNKTNKEKLLGKWNEQDCETVNHGAPRMENISGMLKKTHSPREQKDKRSTVASSKDNEIKEGISKQGVTGREKGKSDRKLSTKIDEREEDAGQIMGFSVEPSRTKSVDDKKQQDGNTENTCESATSGIGSIGTVESGSEVEEGDRLVIVLEKNGSPLVTATDEPGRSSAPKTCRTPGLSSRSARTTKKSTNAVRSEMYKKMHKKLAIQTSRMKELGRTHVRKSENYIQNSKDGSFDPLTTTEIKGNSEMKVMKFVASTQKTQKMESKTTTMLRKRTAVMLPAEKDTSIKAKSARLSTVQHSKVIPFTKIPVASDEGIIMCLFDQALSEISFDDKLLEIVQKFQTPVISAMSCDKLAECCVKFINKLDIGNMWHSVVLTVRYWSDKQKSQDINNEEVLEFHHVASTKERNFIELLHQLSGEKQWSEIITRFMRKMIALIMKTHFVSIAQHGRNIRCVLICARILLQNDPSNYEMVRSVCALLQHVIGHDTSDKVVPMMCYAVAIVPEIVNKLLFEENEQYDPMRRVMRIHLASREEFFTVFSKVIMPHIDVNACDAICMQNINFGVLHNWFIDGVNLIVIDTDGLNLESMELSPKLSLAMTMCHALFNVATSRLFPDKEALILSMLDKCVQNISCYVMEQKKSDEVFTFTTEFYEQQQKELVSTVIRLLLFGRIIISLTKCTECCILPQISEVTERIYKFREIIRLKLEKGDEIYKNRLLYFGLNDWVQVMKPLTKYLHVASTLDEEH